MFGMYGLWHTKDYMECFSELDFFDIEAEYIYYAKKALGKRVNYHCGDSIEYIQNTQNKYDAVIADIPYGVKWHDEYGIPYFFESMVNALNDGGVLIFNIHSEYLKNYGQVREQIGMRAGIEYKDLFFVSRNTKVAYCVYVK